MTKSSSILIMLIFFATTIKSQDYHFIYIQSENKQPFYLRTKEKVYSSTETGYLIIPKLESKQLMFTIGFPKNIWPTSDYQLFIEFKDLGFQLKKVDSLQWALYDLQSSELLSPIEKNANKFQIIQTSTDEFSNMLAEVSNNPAVKQKKINTDQGLVQNKDDNPLIVVKSTLANPDEKISFATSDTVLQPSLTKTVETVVTKMDTAAQVNIARNDETTIPKTDTAVQLIIAKNEETPIPKTDTAVQLIIAKNEETLITKTDTAVQLSISKNDETTIPKTDTTTQLVIAKKDETTIPKTDTTTQLVIAKKDETTLPKTDTTTQLIIAKNDETIIPKTDTAVQLSIAKNDETTITKTDTAVQLSIAMNNESIISNTESAPLSASKYSDTIIISNAVSISNLDVANKDKMVATITDTVNHQISTVSIKNDTDTTGSEIYEQSENQIEPKVITRELSFIDSSGRSLTYRIKDEGIEDHVVIFISYDKPLVFPKLEKDSNFDAKINIKNSAWENDKKEFSSVSNCSSLAKDEDFLLLRREMVAAETELKMIDIAMNSLIKKCWKVDQIKNLAVLLLNEDNKFEFIKMCRAFLADPQQFKDMMQLMTTEKNINNFRALLN